MSAFELYSFKNYVSTNTDALFEASNLAKTGIPKEMISAIHQKEEHRSEQYKNLGYVNMGGSRVTIPYKSFTPSHDIEIPAPVEFTGKKVPPPAGVNRTAHYTDFAQYLQDLPNGPIAILLTQPDSDVFLYLYYKQKWGGGPNAGGQQYAIIVWDKDKKEAVDFGFVGLTTEGVEKRLVRTVHQMKGGNTNAKVQEYINTLAEGAPRRNKPVYAYELEVKEETRGKRTERKERRAITSMDLIRVFANKYAGVIKRAKDSVKDSIRSQTQRFQAQLNEPTPEEVRTFANAIDANPESTAKYLYAKLIEFRSKLWNEGKGAYHKTSGYDLEEENTLMLKVLGRNYSDPATFYIVSKGEDPKDTRVSPRDRRARSLDADKLRRSIPLPGEYADIESMIKAHGLEGTFHKFMFFLMTDRIDSPAVNVLALLGIDPNSEFLEGLPDFEKWTL